MKELVVAQEGERDAQVPVLKSSTTGHLWHHKKNQTHSDISQKHTKVCWVVPLLTEKSQSVCMSRVEPVCNGRGWSFLGRGVWLRTNKTELHWSPPHIASDKDAAKRAARAPPIKPPLNARRERTRSEQTGGSLFFVVAGLRVSRAHRHDAVTARRTAAAAGDSLLQRRPDGGWGKRLKHL